MGKFYNYLIFEILFLLSLFSFLTKCEESEFQQITEFCLEKSERRDCSVFNKCCDFKCQQELGHSSKAHFCMAIFGQILETETECACNTAQTIFDHRRDGMPKIDLILGVILLFIVDLLLLSFAL